MKIKCKFSIIYISNLFIGILPFLYLAGYLDEYSIAMISTAFHEMGHVSAALIKGCRLKSIKVSPVGFNAAIDESNCSRRDLTFIYICGPATNIIIAGLALLFRLFIPDGGQILKNLFILNTSLAVFNLLPAMPLDGGKILFEVLSGYFGIRIAGKYSTKAAIFLAALFIAAGLWQIVRSGGNFSLLVIGIFVFVSLAEGRMEVAFMNIRQIIYRRSRLLKKGIYPARDLVAMKWMHLGECLKCMDYDRVHMIYVLDDDMSVMAMFTESEIIEAILANASDLSFDELVKISCRGKGQDGENNSAIENKPGNYKEN